MVIPLALRLVAEIPLFPVGLGVALFAALTSLLLAAWLWPGVLFRGVLGLFRRVLYRTRVVGRDRVPPTGGVLLLCHRLHGFDWLLLQGLVARPLRPVVFVGDEPRGLLRHLFRWTKAIVLDGARGRRGVVAGLRAARQALAAGEAVVLFAEGRTLADGTPLPFHRGYARVLRGLAVPVVPVCVDQRWGSTFHVEAGRVARRRTRRGRQPVAIAIGDPLPLAPSAAAARLAVQRLSATAALCDPECLPVHRQFVRTAARHPFRPCVFDSLRPEGLTYGRTLAGALCLAGWLRPRLGDVRTIATWLPPSVGGVLSNIAAALLGKTIVNLNYSAGAESVASAIRQCGVRHVLTSRRFTERLKLEVEPGVELIYLDDVMTQISGRQRLWNFLKVLLLPGAVLERVLGLTGPDHGLDDLATVIFSSGSTGEPKGVQLTHRNIASNAMACVQQLQIEPRDRLLGILPLFHSFGYTVTMWTPLQVGTSAVYYPDPRAAQEIGELCKKYRCTIFLTTPTFLRFCLRRCQPDDFASLHLLVCGAEKLPPTLAAEFEERFHLRPLEGYGCTELAPVVGANTPDKPLGSAALVRNKTGSIGEPFPGVAVKVVNPDDPDEEWTPGREGLLLATGPNVMRGYLHREEQTRQVLRDGWYVTGDMARIDEDGFVVLTGRLSRFAKVAGEMVPLEKVEEELHALLNTAERQLAVTCVPDEARGERLVVLYTDLLGQEPRGLGRGLTAKGLPNLWVPNERDYHRVAELPVLGSGKLDLKRLQDEARRIVATRTPVGPHAPREATPRPTALPL